MTAVLDHLAIGTPTLTDGVGDLFGGVLGGNMGLYGGDSPGYWWGQLEFAAGPKIELLTPTGGPYVAFLERFLATRGASPHHFNFIVTDIEATLTRIRSASSPSRSTWTTRTGKRRSCTRAAPTVSSSRSPSRAVHRGRRRRDRLILRWH